MGFGVDEVITVTQTSTHTADPARRHVERRLRAAWRKEQRLAHVRGLCHLLLWAVALALADLVIDWYLTGGKMPFWGRAALLGVNVVAILYVAWTRWLRRLRWYNPLRVALQVERRHPRLNSLLVSYVQLGPDAPVAQAASPALMEALRQQAVESTARLNFREIVSYRELRKMFLVTCSIAICFTALNLRWGEFFQTLLCRMVDPNTSRTYPTRVHIERVGGSYSRDSQGEQDSPRDDTEKKAAPRETIEFEGGDVCVPAGAELTINIVCAEDGYCPAESLWSIRAGDGPWEKLVVPRGEARVFSHSFGQVFRDFSYKAKVGDAETAKVYEVTVAAPPRIVEAKATLLFPPYTGLAKQEVRDLNLEIPEGTEIQWRLRCDRPLDAAELVRTGGDGKAIEAPMTIAAGGTELTFHIRADDSFSYRFRWKDRDHGFRYRSDVEQSVQVVHDAAPQVDILEPSRGGLATAKYGPVVRFQATDDYGVSSAWILSQINEQKPVRQPVDGAAGATFIKGIPWKLQASLPAVKEGDTVTIYVEVADNRGPPKGPQLARSQPVKVEIVSEAEYMRAIAERVAQQADELKKLLKEETSAQGQVQTLRGGEPPDESSGSESSPSGPASSQENKRP